MAGQEIGSEKLQFIYQTFYKGGSARPRDIDKMKEIKALELAQQQAVVAEKTALDVQKRPLPIAEPTPLDFGPIHTTTDKGELVPFVTSGSEQSFAEKEVLGMSMKTWAWIVGVILLLIILIVVATRMSKTGK